MAYIFLWSVCGKWQYVQLLVWYGRWQIVHLATIKFQSPYVFFVSVIIKPMYAD
jgi:hypothetical protein